MWIKLLPLLKKLLELAMPFLRKKMVEIAAKPVETAVPAQAQAQAKVEEKALEPEKPVGIDWSNPKSRINKRFVVKEATYLPSWGVSHIPNEEQKKQIVDIATRVDNLMDKLEEQLGKKLVIDVHVFIRPGVASVPGTEFDGLDYNNFLYQQIWDKAKLTPEERAKKKVPNSPHKRGNALDFHLLGYEGGAGNDTLRALILPHLEEFGLRMEDLPGSTWTHLDSNPVISKRFFKP